MEDPTLTDKKVLIIGDDARTIFSTINLLESYKMKVDSASGGVECIEIHKKSSNFDLIIVDLHAAILQIMAQPGQMVSGVAQCFTDATFRQAVG